MNYSRIVTLFVFCLLFACESKDCCVLEEGSNGQLSGTWLLVERGFSPGSGYITEPVSVSPAQTLTFQSNGKMISTLEGQQDFGFYFIQDNPDPLQRVIAFYKHFPGVSPDPSTFTMSYHISIDGNDMKLYFRYCIEGCHLKFRRIE